ncbi:MAG: putative ABC exporter domain-containing protein [Oscillospiraceae bacterium]|nr:putative ABC exporter domain-containing protein [Oscillospiraceae bacterium]
MKLFFYYAFHSFVNQLRKVLKTWVAVFLLVCIVIGAAIGFGAAKISDLKDAQDAIDAQTETVDDVELPPELEDYTDGATMEETLGIDRHQLVELVAGAVILAVFVMQIAGADKNGSKIFLPADVTLLFAAPMRPQSVLLFRLMTQLGMALLGSVYLLFQLPNLTLNLGLSTAAALSIILTWFATIFTAKLTQVLLYLLCSSHERLKANLRRILIAVLAAVLAGYLAFWQSSGLAPAAAAAKLFCAPWTRFIPLWGWLKGVAIFAAEGPLWAAAACLAATALGCVGLMAISLHLDVDFYEDAMSQSEETAERMARLQAEQPSRVMLRRKKDRSDRLRRDGLNHGRGASVFFFKTMYNRFRFAHLGFLTKTTETYLAAAVAVAVFCRMVLDVYSILPVALVLSACAFFRALGDPLPEDVENDYFRLVPEQTGAKLWYSLLGGAACCALDVLPAMVVGGIVMKAMPWQMLAWTAFAVSVDFFSSTVGTFISVSLPSSMDKTMRQVVMIMFVYFGLIPNAGIMVLGIVLHHVTAAAVIAAGVNVGLGLIFFALSPLFLPPQGGK